MEHYFDNADYTVSELKENEIGTHTSEENTTLIWESEDGHSRLSVICYATDEYGDVKRIEYSYE